MATAAEERRAVLLRGDDNVAVAARPIPKGCVLDSAAKAVEVREPVALGHKVALADIAEGEPVRKYGQIIGFASKAIAEGSWVHVHNVKADLFERDYAFAIRTSHATDRRTSHVSRIPAPGWPRRDAELCRRHQHGELLGEHVALYRRPLSRQRLEEGFPERRRRVRDHPQRRLRDAIRGQDHRTLERVLAGFATHPNVAAYVSGRARLRSQLRAAMSWIRRISSCSATAKRNGTAAAEKARPRMLNIQEQGGIAKTVEAAVAAVHELLPEANSWTRSTQPASKIHLAMECGGSDGNSGVTANPGAGSRGRPAHRARRHGRPRRNDRDLRGRAPVDAPRGVARGRRETRRSDQVVGVVLGPFRCRDQQQPFAWQQERRP